MLSYTRMCLRARACVRACVHTYARAYVRACIRTRVHTYARAYVYTRVLACASTCVRLCTRICACVAEAPSPPATGPGVAAIGANCTSAGDCSAAGAVCERRVCRCPQETPVHDTELNRCLKGVSVNDTCEVSSQCHVMSDLTNCTDSRCMCLYDLIEVQDKNGWHCAVDGTEATRQLGEQCESNSECGVLGGECRNLQCQCHTELPLNNKQDMCGKDANLDEFCRFDEQCTEKMLHTECREHRCRCQQGRVPYPDSHGLIGCMERGKKKMGDPCEDTLQCGFDNALCPEGRKRCQCHPDYPITDGLEKCGQKRTINQSCTFNDECEQGVTKTVCSGGICVCIYGMTAQRSNGGWSCGAPQEAPKQETHLDPAMIGVLVGMALMFIILCVVLRLFSKARWRENRTIFNTPNPRLMNVSLLRDSKLLHSGGERRGSRASVRAPSRQPSMASLRPQSPSQSLGSRAGSRRGSRASSNASGTSTKSPKSPTRPEANNTAAPVLENVTVEVQDPKV